MPACVSHTYIVSSAVSSLSVGALPLPLTITVFRSMPNQLLAWTYYSFTSFLYGTMTSSGLFLCFIEAHVPLISWQVLDDLVLPAYLIVQQHIEMKIWSNSHTERWDIATLASGGGYCSRDTISHPFYMILFLFLPAWKLWGCSLTWLYVVQFPVSIQWGGLSFMFLPCYNGPMHVLQVWGLCQRFSYPSVLCCCSLPLLSPLLFFLSPFLLLLHAPVLCPSFLFTSYPLTLSPSLLSLFSKLALNSLTSWVVFELLILLLLPKC